MQPNALRHYRGPLSAAVRETLFGVSSTTRPPTVTAIIIDCTVEASLDFWSMELPANISPAYITIARSGAPPLLFSQARYAFVADDEDSLDRAAGQISALCHSDRFVVMTPNPGSVERARTVATFLAEILDTDPEGVTLLLPPAVETAVGT